MKLQESHLENRDIDVAELDKFCGNSDWLMKARVLIEALPYMQKFANETFIIKYGGAAMIDPALATAFAKDVVLMKQIGINPIVVHGGGPQIDQMLERLNIQSHFVDGLRVTCAQSIEVVEMVLSGLINKDIVQKIRVAGGSAVGISGKDAGLIEARKMRYVARGDGNVNQMVDLGFVGEPVSVDPEILFFIEESESIPVIAPVCCDADGVTYNVNADMVAGALAVSLLATKMIMLTDVRGVMDKNGKIISEMTLNESESLVEAGVVRDGMLPKLMNCNRAVRSGCGAAHIIDGRIPHVLLLEIFTEYGTGTMISGGVTDE